ncbi:MAG: hypothetical protein IPK04_11105 [Bdellovibrionales bacterium]|jgi:hypothetical protein|nr:hypothetical protein [Bdellovibrionales bacterium]
MKKMFLKDVPAIRSAFYIFLFILTLNIQTFAKDSSYLIKKMSLKEVASKTLEYTFTDQVSIADRYYWRGEFRTKIQSTLVPALVGVGKMITRDDEATGFTTASVVNQLAQLYLENPESQNESPFSKIPEAIALGVKTFDRYKAGESYNFYPALILKNGMTVRRPIAMTLFPIWHGFTNVPNDADTTSSVLAAQIYNSRINKQQFEVRDQSLAEFGKYLDLIRSPMFYNSSERQKETGAFMTWLFDENDPNMPRFYFASSKKGERIPFNKNDVDCIVNLNVLKVLALSQKSSEGHESACRYLNNVIERDQSVSCGIYYPNTYNLAFAVAGASQAGESCIKDNNKQALIKKILDGQGADGSWVNAGNMWEDKIISTAFALYALIEFGESKDLSVRFAKAYGLRYLLSQAKIKNGLIFWKEDNFFTATAIARSLVMWRSKAYTNTIIANVLLKIHKQSPDLRVGDYVKTGSETPGFPQ